MKFVVIAFVMIGMLSCGKKKDEETAAADCFTASVKPIIDSKCASCHTNHTSKFYESKTAYLASQAKTRVASTTSTVMPPSGSTALTAAEKTTFADCK